MGLLQKRKIKGDAILINNKLDKLIGCNVNFKKKTSAKKPY